VAVARGARAVTYVRTMRDRSVSIVPVRITVIIVVRVGRRVIRGWIITGVIRTHVWPFCTSAQKSCNYARAKDRQQQLGFHCCFHRISPFLEFSISLSLEPRMRLCLACSSVRLDAVSVSRPSMYNSNHATRSVVRGVDAQKYFVRIALTYIRRFVYVFATKMKTTENSQPSFLLKTL